MNSVRAANRAWAASRRGLVAGLTLLGLGFLGFDPAAAQTPRVVEALRIEAAIEVDGDLSDPAWREARPATGFTQREPREGEPATEKTEFRVAYTESVLYISVVAWDSQPEAIVAKEMERDSLIYRDDSVVVVLDTFGDQRNGYAFETNANGARFDALITDEGRDVNVEWDGVWQVGTRRSDDGWSVEFAIPFSTLRFDPNLETWGINVRRMIRRKSEEVNWAPLGFDDGDPADRARYAVYRVSLAGRLVGLRDIRPSRQIDIKPFVVSEVAESPGSGRPERENNTEVGLDVKWGMTRNLALDLTYNTDFAEVEVDQQRVNLTRFSLFFPEKRDFFLENAGIFEFGLPQRDARSPILMKTFFSRRIGETGRELATLRGHQNSVWQMAFSSDGGRIVTASSDGTARVWDGSTGEELLVLTGHQGILLHAIFSPDGASVATVAGDATAKVWDSATGELLATLSGHDVNVFQVEFSPDGERLLTVSMDDTVKVWTLDGKELASLPVDGLVYHATWSLDGSTIAVSSSNGTVKLWRTIPWSELSEIGDDEMPFEDRLSEWRRRVND